MQTLLIILLSDTKHFSLHLIRVKLKYQTDLFIILIVVTHITLIQSTENYCDKNQVLIVPRFLLLYLCY